IAFRTNGNLFNTWRGDLTNPPVLIKGANLGIFMKKFITIKVGAGIILLFSLTLSQAQSQQQGVSDATLGQRFQKFASLEGLEAREEFYKETRKAFPPDTANFTSRFTHDLFLGQLAQESLSAGNLKKYRRHHAALSDPEVLSM